MEQTNSEEKSKKAHFTDSPMHPRLLCYGKPKMRRHSKVSLQSFANGDNCDGSVAVGDRISEQE